MLDKWDYSCNPNLSYKKNFASTKLWNKIKLHINLYILDCSFSMYTEILSYSRATNICWMENNPDGKRAFSSSLLHALIAHNHLLFFNIFSNLAHFCPNFQIFCPFLTFFCVFSKKSHACDSFCFFVLVFWIQPSYSLVESIQKE